MSQQKVAFLAGEGDAYFGRNPPEIDPSSDSILAALASLELSPTRIVEIGCGAGSRLQQLKAIYHADCSGVDPSATAIAAGRAKAPGIRFQVGTADSLPFKDKEFDLVIFGFCLYLCDPEDHFKIGMEADRVLADAGYLVIMDFSPPAPYRNPYAPRPGLFSHKMQFHTMFTWHPAYRMLSRRHFEHDGEPTYEPDASVSIDVLRKDLAHAFPHNPWQTHGREREGSLQKQAVERARRDLFKWKEKIDTDGSTVMVTDVSNGTGPGAIDTSGWFIEEYRECYARELKRILGAGFEVTHGGEFHRDDIITVDVPYPHRELRFSYSVSVNRI